MKSILIVGNYRWNFYEEALYNGFVQCGYTALKFELSFYSFKEKILKYSILKMQNDQLFNYAVSVKADIIFLYRTNDIFFSTILRIKGACPNTKILIYHNDNPFLGWFNKVKYRLFLNLIKIADITYVYRPSNLIDAKNLGARTVKVLMPYFYSKIHYCNSGIYNEKQFDVVYVGHYEKDNRIDYLNHLIKNNVKVKVFGPGWNKISKKHLWPEDTCFGPKYGSEYVEVLSNSKIALCFLSKKNNDVYTRRCFEIPAIGTCLLTQHTKELGKLFRDNEIVFFTNKDDLLIKVNFLLQNPETLKEISKMGQKRVKEDSHSEVGRAFSIIRDVEELN